MLSAGRSGTCRANRQKRRASSGWGKKRDLRPGTSSSDLAFFDSDRRLLERWNNLVPLLVAAPERACNPADGPFVDGLRPAGYFCFRSLLLVAALGIEGQLQSLVALSPAFSSWSLARADQASARRPEVVLMVRLSVRYFPYLLLGLSAPEVQSRDFSFADPPRLAMRARGIPDLERYSCPLPECG